MPEGQSIMSGDVPSPSSDFDLERALGDLTREELLQMQDAGREMLNCQRVLQKTASNVVAELLRNSGTFYEWNHYPKGDVTDWETHSQYYYHAHPKDDRPGEHGHFHTFLRYGGMPSGVSPLPLTHPQKPNKDRIGAHIVAVSMDKKGFGIKMFTVNRWVTDETWYPAEEMVRMIERFEIDHTFPSWASNRWLSASMVLFKPQILHLLQQRDQSVAAWAAAHPDGDVFEDRGLEITSSCDIDVDRQMAALKKAMAS